MARRSPKKPAPFSRGAHGALYWIVSTPATGPLPTLGIYYIHKVRRGQKDFYLSWFDGEELEKLSAHGGVEEAHEAAKGDWALRQLGHGVKNNPRCMPHPWESIGNNLDGNPTWRRSASGAGAPHGDQDRYIAVFTNKQFWLWWDPGWAASRWGPKNRRKTPLQPDFIGQFDSIPQLQSAVKTDMAFRPFNAKSNPMTRRNPPKIKGFLPPFPEKYRGLDIYDPREESIRAVVRGSGKWGVGIGHYAKKHSAEEIIQRSWERYQQPDQLIRNRQEYELGLGEMRQSGPYRTTLEPTTSGLRYFVWPLAARQRVPKPFRSKREAEAEKARRYRHGFRPRTDLGRKTYTKTELSGWLPPTSIFAGRSKRFSTAGKKELLPVPSRRQIPRKGKSLAAKYREYDPNWKSRPRLVARYKRKREPPSR